jgi:hypothetical protein
MSDNILYIILGFMLGVIYMMTVIITAISI